MMMGVMDQSQTAEMPKSVSLNPKVVMLKSDSLNANLNFEMMM